MSKFKKEFLEAFELIKNSHYVVIVTHINPDADTLSSALAMSSYMYRNNINHKVFNSAKQLPRNLDFLPRFSKIIQKMPEKYDLVIYVDCGDKLRIGTTIDKKCKVINIDHHQSNDDYGDINIVDSQKASTAEVLYGFFDHNNINITKEIATCLYTGIYDDSIAFTTPRTDKKTFEVVSALVETNIDIAKISEKYSMRDSLAKYRLLPKILETLELYYEGCVAIIYQKQEWLESTGANFNECDDVVNEILKINIVKIALYLREDDNHIRVSLRGKGDNNINLSEIASNFNGGGHINAAGATFKDFSLEEVTEKLLAALKSYI
jgi:phosphoesterase RecJ-like protein